MASTRNRNTQGDYHLEQTKHDQVHYQINREFSVPPNSYLPGQGLLPSRMHCSQLSHNSNEIESFLFGIGSTNLCHPNLRNVNVNNCHDQERTLSSLNIAGVHRLIMPEDTTIRLDQRPYMTRLTI